MFHGYTFFFTPDFSENIKPLAAPRAGAERSERQSSRMQLAGVCTTMTSSL